MRRRLILVLAVSCCFACAAREAPAQKRAATGPPTRLLDEEPWLDLHPLVDPFSPDCAAGCEAACRQYGGGDPGDCRAVCEDTCGKDNLVVVSKNYYSHSQDSSQTSTISGELHYSFDLEPQTADSFVVAAAEVVFFNLTAIKIDRTGSHTCHAAGATIDSAPIGSIVPITIDSKSGKITGARIPAAAVTLHLVGDPLCDGPLPVFTGVMLDVIKMRGSLTGRAGDGIREAAERWEMHEATASGELRQLYQWYLILNR